MALSMDEQRILAEIERRLAAEDPGLAAKLSSFKRPGPGGRFRSSRGLLVGSVFAVAAAVAVSMVVYAMVPFRAHAPQQATIPSASGNASISAPARTTGAESRSGHPTVKPSSGISAPNGAANPAAATP